MFDYLRRKQWLEVFFVERSVRLILNNGTKISVIVSARKCHLSGPPERVTSKPETDPLPEIASAFNPDGKGAKLRATRVLLTRA